MLIRFTDHETYEGEIPGVLRVCPSWEDAVDYILAARGISNTVAVRGIKITKTGLFIYCHDDETELMEGDRVRFERDGLSGSGAVEYANKARGLYQVSGQAGFFLRGELLAERHP